MLVYKNSDKHIILNPYTCLFQTIESVHKKKRAFKRLEYFIRHICSHRNSGGNAYAVFFFFEGEVASAIAVLQQRPKNKKRNKRQTKQTNRPCPFPPELLSKFNPKLSATDH